MRLWLFLALVVLAGCATPPRSRRWSSICYDWCYCDRSLAGLAAEGLIGALLSTSEPKQEPPPPAVRQLAAATAAPVYRRPRDGRIHTRVMFAGGHLQLIGVPEKSRDQVVLAFRPVAPLDQGCALHLYRDGAPLTVGERQRRSDHELLVALRMAELGASRRFVGEACGRTFELDAAGRDTIANFVSRFQERVEELSASPSTPLANAR